MSNLSRSKQEQKIRRQINGLSFVEFKIIGMSLKVNKCTLYQPVYILGFKLFENEDKLFKVKRKNNKMGQNLFDDEEEQKLRDQDIIPLNEFKEFLNNDKFKYIHKFEQEKRQEEGGFVCKKCKKNRAFKDESQIEESKQNDCSDLNFSKLKSNLRQEAKMNNIIFIFNEDEDVTLEQIKEQIKFHNEQKNIIQLSHFMNVNSFNSYENFNKYLEYQISEMRIEFNKRENLQSKEKHQFFESLDAIVRALKNKKKIILFDEYHSQQVRVGTEDIDIIHDNFTNHTFYALAAEEIPDYDYIVNCLHYYHKVSPYSIFSNVQERLNNIAFSTVKDVLYYYNYDRVHDKLPKKVIEYFTIIQVIQFRYYPTIHSINLMEGFIRQNVGKDLYSAIKDHVLDDKIKVNQILEKKWDTNECESIFYKNICSHGLLPVNVYLNDQNQSTLSKVFGKFFMKFLGIDIPFPQKFHLNIQIMNKFYSYNTSCIFNCKDLEVKERNLNPDLHYTKIRVIDFFPLDQWVEQLGRVLKHQLIPRIAGFLADDKIRKQVQIYFQAVIEDDEQKQIIQQGVLNKEIKNILNQETVIQTIKDISYQFLKEYFFETRLYQKWSQIIGRNEDDFSIMDNNCTTGVSDFISHLTSICDYQYESSDEAYNYDEFLYYFKQNTRKNTENDQNQFIDHIKRVQSFNFDQPYANSNYNLQKFTESDIQLFQSEEQQTDEKEFIKFQKERLKHQFQKFSSQVNQKYLDMVIEPIIFELPIPKYYYYCEISHINYIEQIQNGVLNIESLCLIIEEFCKGEKNNGQIDFQKYKNIKGQILKNILKDEKTPKIEEFDNTHKIIRSLIKLSHNQMYSRNKIDQNQIENKSENKSENSIERNSIQDKQLQRIISVLMNLYDSWYFQRKSRVYDKQQVTYSQQYEIKEILNELTYYYYNSVRLSSDILFVNNTQFSIVGHLIIKNPQKRMPTILNQQI